MPPRKVRVNEELFVLPDGFDALNPSVYRKRFGHMLSPTEVERLKEAQPASMIPVAEPAKH